MTDGCLYRNWENVERKTSTNLIALSCCTTVEFLNKFRNRPSENYLEFFKSLIKLSRESIGLDTIKLKTITLDKGPMY